MKQMERYRLHLIKDKTNENKTSHYCPWALALTACSKLTKENYDKLEMGMSQDEVEAILGSADNCGKTMGTMACTWGNEDSKHVKIVLWVIKPLPSLTMD